jgi:lipopolysaccharide transport system ATP-binding protein
MDHAVVVKNLTKRFHMYHADRPGTLHETFVKGFGRLRPAERFWALRDVSFDVPYGRVVGIVGSNGSGKSTLMRLIAGVGRPDSGSVTVNAHLGALLDLGTGFHPDLTGRENILVNGVISGLTRREVARHFDSIVEFAELRPFIDNPLRTYSSGMQMRLGFAIAIHTRPELLLIDEVLSVGDHSFQQKCLEELAKFRRRGCTIIIVSHDAEQVSEFCDEAIWLSAGRVAGSGPAASVVERYLEESERIHPHVPNPATAR